ncbi:hypothetical protein PR048_018886 [Dryococelus australis]|uniref:Uncharacterized protein n=1 Tax=Dryococelus australis TaxID=614101 RepID=A0ABQ9H1X0_9NEOP|nr:hypothetical protein PR048_018886 [Dryococelus australis]
MYTCHSQASSKEPITRGSEVLQGKLVLAHYCTFPVYTAAASNHCAAWGNLMYTCHSQASSKEPIARGSEVLQESWCLLTTVLSLYIQQQPVTTVQPGETECIPATHKRAARNPLPGIVKCCKESWCLLTIVLSLYTQQQPVTTVQPGETECIPATHKRAARNPLPGIRRNGYVYCELRPLTPQNDITGQHYGGNPALPCETCYKTPYDVEWSPARRKPRCGDRVHADSVRNSTENAVGGEAAVRESHCRRGRRVAALVGSLFGISSLGQVTSRGRGEPMSGMEVSMEQRRNEKKWGEDPRENRPTNGIVRRDSHMRKSTRFTLVRGECATRSGTAAPARLRCLPTNHGRFFSPGYTPPVRRGTSAQRTLHGSDVNLCTEVPDIPLSTHVRRSHVRVSQGTHWFTPMSGYVCVAKLHEVMAPSCHQGTVQAVILVLVLFTEVPDIPLSAHGRRSHVRMSRDTHWFTPMSGYVCVPKLHEVMAPSCHQGTVQAVILVLVLFTWDDTPRHSTPELLDEHSLLGLEVACLAPEVTRPPTSILSNNIWDSVGRDVHAANPRGCATVMDQYGSRTLPVPCGVRAAPHHGEFCEHETAVTCGREHASEPSGRGGKPRYAPHLVDFSLQHTKPRMVRVIFFLIDQSSPSVTLRLWWLLHQLFLPSPLAHSWSRVHPSPSNNTHKHARAHVHKFASLSQTSTAIAHPAPEVSRKQRRECKGGENGRTPRNPPTGGIVGHDSHTRKTRERSLRGIKPGSATWEATSLTTRPPWPHSMQQDYNRTLRRGWGEGSQCFLMATRDLEASIVFTRDSA